MPSRTSPAALEQEKEPARPSPLVWISDQLLTAKTFAQGAASWWAALQPCVAKSRSLGIVRASSQTPSRLPELPALFRQQRASRPRSVLNQETPSRPPRGWQIGMPPKAQP